MSNLQTALNLARLGYYVHPLAPKDKRPIAEHGSSDATRDEATIRDWWDRWPNANIGISLDKSGLVDIAPDCPEWAERFRANGMPHTTAYASGNGPGHWHALYRLPPGGPQARSCVPQQYDIMSSGNAVAPGSTHPSGRTYDLQSELLPVKHLPFAPAWAVAMLRPRDQPTNIPGAATALDWRTVEHWLGTMDTLIGWNGLPKGLSPKGQSGRIIRAGGLAEDRSLARCIVAKGLAMIGYSDTKIAAFLWHYCDYGHISEKGSRWLQADISRIITQPDPIKKNHVPDVRKALNIVPRPDVIVTTQPAAPIVEVARPKIGRPHALTADAAFISVIGSIDLSSVVMQTVGALASAHNVSRSTWERFERQWRADGLVQRITPATRCYSYLEITEKGTAYYALLTRGNSDYDAFRGTNGSANHCTRDAAIGRPGEADRAAVSATQQETRWAGENPTRPAERPTEPDVLGTFKTPPATRDSTADLVPSDSTPVRIGVPETPIDSNHGGTHLPVGAIALGAPARITISIVSPRHARADALIYEAIVAIDSQQPAEVLDRKTGELHTIKLRVNKKRVARYLLEQHRIVVHPDVLDELYPEQLLRRTRERKIAALAELTPAGLRAQLRLAEHMAEKCKADEEPVARWWAFYRDAARKEQARRPADPSRPAGGLRNCEALPDMRAAGGRRQAELCDIADDALLTLRAQRQGRAHQGAVCPPKSTPAGVPAAGLVERLYVLKAQREQEASQ